MFGFSSVMLGTMLLSATGGLGLPFGVPPTPEDAALSRIAPEETLFYLSWAGTASPDSKSTNQTEQLLAEPEVQNFLRQVSHAFNKAIEKNMEFSGGEKEKMLVKEYINFLESCALHPGALYLSKRDSEKPAADKADSDSDESKVEEASENPLEILGLKELADFEGGIVLALGDEASHFDAFMEKALDYRREREGKKSEDTNKDGEEKAKEETSRKDSTNESLEVRVAHIESRLIEKANEEPAQEDESFPGPKIEKIEIDGKTWHRCAVDGLPDRWAIWGAHKGYFIATIGKDDAVQKLLKRMEAEPPRWFTAIRRQAPVERRTLVSYLDLKQVRELIAKRLDPDTRSKAKIVVDMLGLSNATAFIEVWGLDGDNFVNKTFLALDGEPQGLLRTISDKPLKIEDLAAIPRDATSAMAFRLDLHEALETVLNSMEKTSPDLKAEFNGQLDAAGSVLGIDLRHGVIDALGDTWSVYSSPSEGNYATVVVPLKDGAAAKLAFGQLMGMLKKNLTPEEKPKTESGQEPSFGPENSLPRIEQFEFEGHQIYCLNCDTVAPSWCLTDHNLVIGLLPQDIKAHLTRGSGHEPMDRDSRIATLLSGEHAPSFLMYWNPKSIFRFGYSWLLMMAPTYSNVLRQFDEEINLSIMPSLPAIDRHMGPTTATVRRTPDGIEFASRGTIPLPADAATFVAFCILSQYETFFNFTSSMPPQPVQPAQPEKVEEKKAEETPFDEPVPDTPTPSATPSTAPDAYPKTQPTIDAEKYPQTPPAKEAEKEEGEAKP